MSEAESSALVRVPSSRDREYLVRLVEIETRKSLVIELQAELAPLLHALERFELAYRARVGSLTAELHRVHLAIEEVEERAARAHAQHDGAETDLDAAIDADFEDRWRQVEDEAAEASRSRRAFLQQRARPTLGARDEADARRLYRELAKRYHPDLARTGDDREKRQAIMLRVNAAYRDRDLGALRALGHEAEVDDPSFNLRAIRHKLAWALREVLRLDGVIADLRDHIQTLLASDTYPLWSQTELGEAVIAKREEVLRRELAIARERQTELRTSLAAVPAR